MLSTANIETPLAAFEALRVAHPDHPAILQADRRVSFADLFNMSSVFCAGMKAKGVVPQTGVVLALPNGPATAAAVLASWRLGAYPVFVSPNAPERHQALAQELTQAALVLTPENISSIEDCSASNFFDADIGRTDSIGSVVFTSGSTGNPKGVMQTTASLLSGAQRVGRLNGYSFGGRILCPVPFSHDYGWGQLLSCLCLGQTLVLPSTEGLSAICEAIEQHRPDVFAGTPAVFSGLVYGISEIRTTPRSSITKVTSTGAHLSPELAGRIEDLFPDVQIFANYGLTETYRSACLLPEHRKGREASVGRAIEGVRLVVVDAASRIVPPGTEGEIVHIGAGACLGYVGDLERTAQLHRQVMDGETPLKGIYTGDFGILDQDGFLTISGRRDRLIKTMDVRISLESVERDLAPSGLVAQVAAIDVADRIMGRKIVAVVVLKSGAAIADLKAWARAHMSKFTLPRVFHVVEAMPLTVSGKIDYVTLKRQYGDGPRS